MTNRAFCVGINRYPIRGAKLRGCVNDAKAWAALLTDHYDFAPADVQLLTDADATKRNMVAGVKRLLRKARSGDVLVFTNSSHGSYVADRDGDEDDRYDEIICTYDVRDNPLLDDELSEIFDAVPAGVRLTVISDSCHSGNVTRVAPAEILPGLVFEDDRRPRFLSPSMWSDQRRSRRIGDGRGRVLPNAARARPRRRERRPQSAMKEVLVSGCRDTELSWDARIDGVARGAMSYFAQQAIAAARYKITYDQLARRLTARVTKAGYPQHPQVEGRPASRRRQIFT